MVRKLPPAIAGKTVRTAWIVTGGHCRADAFSRGDPAPDLLLAADAGWKTAHAAGLVPDLVCGDFDSSETPGTVWPHVPLYRVPAEKDDTDTMLACDLACLAGAKELVVFGGTGGRIDHSLSNLFLLEHLRRRGADARLTDGDNRVRLLENETLLLRPAGYRYFSLIALDRALVTLRGCKYPLEEGVLTRALPFAVSNEITCGQAEITVRGGGVFLIESAYTAGDVAHILE